MPKKKKPEYTFLPYWSIALATLLTSVLVVAGLNRQTPAPANTNTPADTVATIVLPDGAKIYGDLTLPDRGTNIPVVVLLHDFGRSRTDWQSVVSLITISGIGVLQLDMRGFGASRVPRIVSTTELTQQLPHDLQSVMAYLATQPRVDQSRLSVMGVGYGGLVGLAAATENSSQIYHAILLDPIMPSGLSLDLAPTPADVLTIMNRALTNNPGFDSNILAPAQSLIVDDAATGITMLELPAVRTRVLEWLTRE